MHILLFVTIIFSGIYALLIMYYLRGWLALKEYKPENKIVQTKVTVIIAARNEEKNLPHILDDLNEQHISKHLFEVIVVDDFSTDRTAEAVKNSKLSNVKYISLKDTAGVQYAQRANKKLAITTGIQSAMGNLIITTDADCRLGSNWIQVISNYFEQHNPVMIAGPVNFFFDPTFLGKFQTLDFLSLVGIGAASIKNGFYNLCNGANLAYTKEAFYAVDGYKNIDHISSGDDMMLMHKMAKKFPHKIAYIKNKDAIVYTTTEKDLFAFWRQRVRWTSKSTHYEDKRITAILTFAYLFNVLLPVNLIYGLFDPFYLRVAMWQFMIKIIVDTIFTYSIAKFFRRENLLWLFLPMQAAHIIYILAVAPAAVFGKYTWKERKIHDAKK